MEPFYKTHLIDNMYENQHWSITNIIKEEFYFNGNPDLGKKSSAMLEYRDIKRQMVSNFVVCLQINALLEIEDIIECVKLDLNCTPIQQLHDCMFDILWEHNDLSFSVKKIHGIYHYEIPLPFELLLKNKALILSKFQDIRLGFTFAKPKISNHHILDSKIKYDLIDIEVKEKATFPQPIYVPILQYYLLVEENIDDSTYLKKVIDLNPETCALFLIFTNNNKVITDDIIENIGVYVSGIRHDTSQPNAKELKYHIDIDCTHKYKEAVIKVNFRKMPDKETKICVCAVNKNTLAHSDFHGLSSQLYSY